MSVLARSYDFLLSAAAVIAAAMFAAIFVTVVWDVSLRTLGLYPPQATSAASEYALFYATMLAAPWLVRQRGHIYVQIGVDALDARTRFWLERAICVFCIALSTAVAVVSFDIAWESFARREWDVRSIDIPRCLLFAPMPLGFGLVAVEFIRILVRGEQLHRDRDPANDGL